MSEKRDFPSKTQWCVRHTLPAPTRWPGSHAKRLRPPRAHMTIAARAGNTLGAPISRHCAGWSAVCHQWHTAPAKTQMHNIRLRAAISDSLTRAHTRSYAWNHASRFTHRTCTFDRANATIAEQKSLSL